MSGFPRVHRGADLDLDLAPFSSPTAAFLIIPPALSGGTSELRVAVGLPGNLDLIRRGAVFPRSGSIQSAEACGSRKGPGTVGSAAARSPRPAPRRERAPARDAYSYEQELPD